MMTLLLILMTHVVQPGVLRDDVDQIEVNHFYDDNGKRVFEQLIFWDWSSEDSRHQVRAWRSLKSVRQLPRREWRTGDMITIWMDGEKLRLVRSKSRVETWTQFDPEFRERGIYPQDKRKGLRK